ncbi:conserved hypothetical protein [Culex quinquefasciatus]|uniref:HTH CENPB-type domain-containing protein n=1 Tax=Culex quinquefasciatus TaxID=7176 RepID=B0X132_CULQU|nr:conserved hypothetical protein [Culex quinquefasciatus]|eukprot:XP_001863354.1 conserved hypothetical protein [Culex quinquefasciatus]
MVRNYVRKTCRQECTVAQLDSAIRAVRNGCSKTEAARSFGVPKKTLLRYLRQVEGPVIRRELGSFKTVFNPAQEQQLVNYILDMCRTFYGLTPKDVRSMAYQMAKANNIPHPFNHEEKHAGTDWFYCFRKRFPNLVLRVAEPTSMERAKGFNRKSVGDYFQLVSNIFAEHFYPPDKFYNMDEFGVLTKANRVVAERGQDQVGGMVSAEKGVTTTVVFAMSAAGDFVPPMFIFPRQRMNDALKEEPVLLLFDGHKSHTKNLQLLEKARRNHVRIVSIPPHTSHKLQPCDLTLMASVRSHCNSASHSLLRHAPPGRLVTPYDICSLMGQAFSLSASRSTAENGFRRAALVPFNPAIFTDEDFASADYLSQMNVGQAPIGNDSSEVRDEEELGVQPEQEELVDVEQVQNEQEPGGVDHLVPVELHTVEDTKDQSQIIIEKDVYFLIQDNDVAAPVFPGPDAPVDNVDAPPIEKQLRESDKNGAAELLGQDAAQ